MTFDHLKDTLGIFGDISNIQGARERRRVGRLPDCPYCGHKIPKAGVKLCGQCRYEIAWVRGVPCENNPQAIQNLEQMLEKERELQRAERELQRAEREKNRTPLTEREKEREKYRSRFQKKLNELEWRMAIKVGLPSGLLLLFLLGVTVYYCNAFQKDTMESNVAIVLFFLLLASIPLWAIGLFVIRFWWREKDLTKLIEELESQTGKKTSKRT